MSFPRQDAVSEAPLLEHQEEEEVFREDGQSMDGPQQATQVPEGEAGRSGQSTAPQGTQGANPSSVLPPRKADRSSNSPLWPFLFLLELSPLLTKVYPSILSSTPFISESSPLLLHPLSESH